MPPAKRARRYSTSPGLRSKRTETDLVEEWQDFVSDRCLTRYKYPHRLILRLTSVLVLCCTLLLVVQHNIPEVQYTSSYVVSI